MYKFPDTFQPFNQKLAVFLAVLFLVKTPDIFYSIRAKHYILILVLATISGCSPYKTLSKGEYLLKKNHLKVDRNIRKPKTPQINEQILLKPNRKILGVYKFHLRAYSLGTSKRKPHKNEKKRIRKFLRNKVGEPPVIVDSASVRKSATNINQLMFNKGYFNSKTSYRIKYKGKRRRRAHVYFTVSPGEFYRISNLQLLTNQFDIDSTLEANQSNSFLKVGDQVDFSNLTKERNRISLLLRNSGYYYFGKEFVEYDLYTSGQEVNVETGILTPDNQKNHLQIAIDQISVVFPVIEAYSKKSINTENKDGILYDLHGYPLSTDLLHKRIKIRPNTLYSQANTELTYAKLSELNIFKSIDVVYSPAQSDSANKLEVSIYRKPVTKQEYTIEPQGVLSYDVQSLAQTNQNRSFGIGNALTYTNRNTFGHAEQLDLSSVTSFQAQIGGRSNTIFEQSVNARIKFPGSNLLKRLDHNPKVLNYSTQIMLLMFTRTIRTTRATSFPPIFAT